MPRAVRGVVAAISMETIMTGDPEDVVEKARCGRAPYANCPGYPATQGCCVKPDLMEPDTEVLIFTWKSGQYVDESKHESWEGYHEPSTTTFRNWKEGWFIFETRRSTEGSASSAPGDSSLPSLSQSIPKDR